VVRKRVVKKEAVKKEAVKKGVRKEVVRSGSIIVGVASRGTMLAPYPQPEPLKVPRPSRYRRRAGLSLSELYAARTRAREKYARAIARDPEGFRAQRAAIQRRYDQKQRDKKGRDHSRRPGVEVELIF
jgi:hypothetical protein